MKLEGQAAIVTGGGQGIGRAVVERLAAEGARVAVLDMNPDNAQEVIDGLDTPSNHLAFQTNVADSASVIASIRQARETFGRLDMAVNNAGIGQAPGDGSDKFYEAMEYALNVAFDNPEESLKDLNHAQIDEVGQRVMTLYLNPLKKNGSSN